MVSEELIFRMANYIIDNKATIRKTAIAFNRSKTGVHRLIHNKLKKLDIDLYCKVKKVLRYNLNARAERGGRSTRIRWAKIKCDRLRVKIDALLEE